MFIQELFSGVDNKTADIGRVIWFISVLAYIGLTGYALYMGEYRFSPLDFGTGLAAIIGSGGAALHFKSATEPVGK